jgi:undecaprenyl-diphosphatase
MTTVGCGWTVPPRRPEPRLRFVGWLLLLAACFVALAVLVSARPVLSIDVQLERAVQSVQSPWLDVLAAGLSLLGFPPWSIAIDGLIVLAIAIAGQRWAAACAALAAAGSAGLWFAVLALVHRPRPTADLVHVTAQIGYGSFPSGHALNTLAFYGFLALLAVELVQPRGLRLAAVAACVAIVVGIGFARVYVGEHWPTDVLGGYLLGAAWLLITRRIYVTGRPRLFRRSRAPSRA